MWRNNCHLVIFLFLFQFFAIVQKSQSANCDDYIKALTEHDIYLGQRVQIASDLINQNATAQQFVDGVDKVHQSEGDKYACGYTRFWIDGILSGTAKQYEERRRFNPKEGIGYGILAGFHDVIGEEKIKKMFDSYADLKDNYVVYHFQTATVADHVWVVLQSPGPQFKIYQSYNMAYSVHAWLQEDITGMFDKGFIRYWDEVYDKFEIFLNAMGGEIFENKTIDFPPGTDENVKAWAYYIVDYNQTTIEENFKMAWNKFGKNKWITKDVFMKDYVEVLQQTVDQMFNYTSSPDELWTKEIHEDWIGLFASPNPACFPNVPFNKLPLPSPAKMELQVKVMVVPMEVNDCYKNFKVIGKTIKDWTDPFEETSSPSQASSRGNGNTFFTAIISFLYSLKFM